MKAGFARVRITPPVGTHMLGFGDRDRAHGCEGVHDELFVRALCLEQGRDEALILGYDLCFLGRADADRHRGAIGRRVDLAPSRILLNTSHLHCGPAVGTWAYADYRPPDTLYLGELEAAAVEAACRARDSMREVTLWAGQGRTALPMSRRRPGADGTIAFAPYPGGVVDRSLPVCLLRDGSGGAVCLLFSVACHPSTVGGFEISADYPGVAMRELDKCLGAPGSLFLQGAGGDAKACVIGGGQEWRRGNWADIEEAGGMVAREVMEVIEGGLTPVEPGLGAHAVEMRWPLEEPMGRDALKTLADRPDAHLLRRLWAERQLARLDRGESLPRSVPITAHGMQLGRGVRMLGLEGELVAGLGLLIRSVYASGVTFALGYTDGAQLYLPTEAMLEEGGYEVDSYYEYGFPARLAKGLEGVLRSALDEMCAHGIL